MLRSRVMPSFAYLECHYSLSCLNTIAIHAVVYLLLYDTGVLSYYYSERSVGYTHVCYNYGVNKSCSHAGHTVKEGGHYNKHTT